MAKTDNARDPAIQPVTYLGVSRVQGNRLQIKTTIEVDRRDDVPVWVSPQPLEGKRKAKVFLLQSRGHATGGTLVRCGRSRGGCGCHPIAVGGLRTDSSIDRGALVAVRGGRGRRKLASRTGEGQGTGRSESLRLSGVGRVGLDSIHLESNLSASLRFGLLRSRTDLRPALY